MPFAEQSAEAGTNLQHKNLQQETYHKQSYVGDLAKGKQWAEPSEHSFQGEKNIPDWKLFQIS